MRVWLRRSVGLLAIYVIAIATILSTAVPPRAASAGFDPFSVICHSGAQADVTSAQQPAAPSSNPAKACDHCTLCNASASAAFDSVVIGILAPAKPLRTARPAEAVRHDDIGGSPRQTRGPPQLT